MSELKTPSNRLILMLLALIIIGLAVQGVIISKLYMNENLNSRLHKVSEHVEILENDVKKKIKESVEQVLSKEGENSQRRNQLSERSTIHGDLHPFQEMRQMRDQIDEMFSHSMERFQEIAGFDQSWLEFPFVPEADFVEKEDHYLFRMDIPGVEKSKLKVSIDDHLLTVSGQKNEVIEQKEGDKVLRTERRDGQFQRSFSIPGGIEGGAIKTEYKEGVITITIPKGEEIHVTREIKLQ